MSSGKCEHIASASMGQVEVHESSSLTMGGIITSGQYNNMN